jgi:hypothetical protein
MNSVGSHHPRVVNHVVGVEPPRWREKGSIKQKKGQTAQMTMSSKKMTRMKSLPWWSASFPTGEEDGEENNISDRASFVIMATPIS